MCNLCYTWIMNKGINTFSRINFNVAPLTQVVLSMRQDSILHICFIPPYPSLLDRRNPFQASRYSIGHGKLELPNSHDTYSQAMCYAVPAIFPNSFGFFCCLGHSMCNIPIQSSRNIISYSLTTARNHNWNGCISSSISQGWSRWIHIQDQMRNWKC